MKLLKLVFVFLMTLIACQSGFIVHAQTGVVKKQVGKVVKSITREEAIEKTAKEAAKSTGKKFVGESVSKQSIKRQLRNDLSKELSENGVTSFQKLGVAASKEQLRKNSGHATSKSSLVGKSKYKQSVSNPNAKSKYALRHPNGHRKQYVDYRTYRDKSSKAKQKLGYKRDAYTLKKNMEKYNGKDLADEGAAHHVVGECSTVAMSKLEKYNIDINDAMVGILLPDRVGSKLQGAKHRGNNGGDYCRTVDDYFRNCESEEDCYYVLDLLKRKLYNGELKINNTKL